MSHESVRSRVVEPPVDATPRPLLFASWSASATLLALLAASIATAGSWFFSQVLGWVPCTLCWYQRILMYPLSAVLLVALLRRDLRAYVYVLPLSLAGMGVAAYHYLLQKTDWFPPPPCTTGVPCTVDYIDIWGFVTVPFLALVAFAIISAAMACVALLDEEAPEALTRRVGMDRIAAIGVVVAVIVAYRIAAWLVFA